MPSEESWTEVKKVLKEKFQQSDARIVWLEDVRSHLRALASGGISTAPDFTLHSEVHSDNVVRLLGRLAGFVKPELMLSEYEAYVLVAAAYLHDIGMFFSAQQFNEVIVPDLEGSLRFCPENLCDSGLQYRDTLVGKPVDFQIRAVHHLLSAYLISEEGDSLYRVPAADKPHVIAIGRGHRKASLYGARCNCYETKESTHGRVRRDLLAALLRLADALDCYPNRAPEEVFRTRAWDFLQSPIALKHWLNHYFAYSVYLTFGDQEGNRFLDCQLVYTVPTRRTLNGKSYESFLAPLFNDFVERARQSDFDVRQYPPILLEVLGMRDIKLNLTVRPEPGAVELPDKIVREIEQSASKDALELVSYLESRKGRGINSRPTASVMNRRQEVQVFQCLMDGDDPQHRLMLVVGDHGQGKTWLLKTFEQICIDKQLLCLRIDLSDTIDFGDIMDGIWLKLGPHHFPKYSAQREDMALAEYRSSHERHRLLTECFFADWQAIGQQSRLVILLDTYERANPVLRDWVEQTFLVDLEQIEQLVIVIGGRQWPKIDDYWQLHGYRFPLESVQVRDYKHYSEQRGLKIPEADLVQLHRAFRGLPKLFVEYVDARVQVGV